MPARPYSPLDEKDVLRLVRFASVAVGIIGGALVTGLLLSYGVVNVTLVFAAAACAAFLALAALLGVGLAARPAAWIFIANSLLVVFLIALNPNDGITAGLMVFLSVLLLFTGAALGAEALTIVAAISVAGLVGIILLDISRLPIAIGHESPVTVVSTGVKQIGAVLITFAMVLGALKIFHAAMDEARDARDEARRASVAKSTFLANAGHEIRTPLNGVLGIAQLLETTELTTEQRRYLAIIRESGHTLLAMLNDLLDLSKVEVGRLAIARSPTEIRPLLADTVEAWRPEAEGDGLALSLQVAPDLPALLEIDRIRVRQCVENLISNAVKFTESGEIRVHAEGHGDGARHELVVTVADTGIGVDAEDLTRIFDPFHQVEGARGEDAGGTGLGLTIVRNLARLMGGDLTCESHRREGSVFTLRIAAPVAVEAPCDREDPHGNDPRTR